jgi:hypothetical protein
MNTKAATTLSMRSLYSICWEFIEYEEDYLHSNMCIYGMVKN